MEGRRRRIPAQLSLETSPALLRFVGIAFRQEEAMERYDIRLRKKGGGAVLAYCTVKENDVAAIRAAQGAMEKGDTVEVWKGMRCIYADERALDHARNFAA